MEWNEEKSKEVIIKHRRRFGIRLTARILAVIAGLLICYVVYINVVNYVYEKSDTSNRIGYYTQLAIDWTNPEYTTEFGRSSNKITPGLTHKQNHLLYKRIGRKNYLISNLTVTKPLFTQFTEMTFSNLGYKEFSDNEFTFSIPYWPSLVQPNAEPEISPKIENELVWRNLEMMDSGNVGVVAFSLDDFYSPLEITQLLANYDLEITWMPIYMGEWEEDFYDDAGTGVYNNWDNFFIARQWGLAPGRYISEDHWFAMSNGGPIREDTVKYTQDVMLQNMERMLDEDINLAEEILHTKNLQQRYNYLKENGFKAFGAVVTGPVKELLSLEDLAGIRTPHLGEVRPWNWYEEEYEDGGEPLDFDAEHPQFDEVERNNGEIQSDQVTTE